MVPNVIERVWVQGTTTKVESLRGTAFTEEDGAHTFRIAGVDASGETVPLSGTVLAKILRADNITIDVSGTITDGVASVTMVGDCYHVPGRFSIVVYLSDGVTTIAIYAAVGDIYRATSDTELDSGTTVPSLAQLEAAYQNALSAAAAANTAATGAERVNVSMSKSGDTITFSATDRTGATTTETMSDQSEAVANLNSALSDSARKIRVVAGGPSRGTADLWLPMKSGDKLYIKNNTSGVITPQLLTMNPRTMVQNFGNVSTGAFVELTANTDGTHISFWLSSAVVSNEEIEISTIPTAVGNLIDNLHSTVTSERNNAIKSAKFGYDQIEEEEEEYYIGTNVTRIDDHTIETNTNFSGFETFPKHAYADGKSVFIAGHLKFTSASIRLLLYWKTTNTTGFENPYYVNLGSISNPNGAGTEYEIDYQKVYTDTAGTMAGMSFVGIGIQNIQTSGDTTTYRISATNFLLRVVTSDYADLVDSDYYDRSFVRMANNIIAKIDEETVQNVDYAHVSNDSNKTNYHTSNSVSGTGTISGNTATITGTNSGIQTNRLQYEGDDILYRIKATITHNAKVFRVLVFGYDAISGGGWQAYSTIYTAEQNPNYETQEVEIDITFDPANFAVYQGYSIFNICYQLQGLNPETNVATEVISDGFSITKEYPYESLEHYDPEFPKLFTKLSTAVSNNTSAIENMDGGSSEAKIVDPDGNKYALRVGGNGTLIAVPHIPSKAIFIGNSYLLGQTFYGMCATDPEYDWYHLTMDAILEKNPSAIAYRCHGAWFEQLGTSGNWQERWNSQTVRFQMDVESSLGWNDIFDDDIDLVVIQLGDNADGTDDRLIAYNANLDAFCHKITTLCPKARFLFLGSSARYTHTKEVTEAVVNKYGMGLIVIQDLRQYSDFNGVPGQTYLLPDGTRAETPSAWLSHAGNGGHQHIADAVIAWMDM